jgi:hypothetical protein
MGAMRLCLTFALLIAVPAAADTLGDVAAAQREVGQLDGARLQVDARRTGLESESQALAREIERVKAEPEGVRRSLRLQELLAGAKAKADELEVVAGLLRQRAGALDVARRRLIAACDRALAPKAGLPEARRLELARLRTTQATLLAAPAAPLGPVGTAAPGPLDGPRELSEKADLLRDSEDKLRREVDRLAVRIDDVERRRHLRERAGALDEDWFGETTSNRKFARITSSTTAAAPSESGAAGGASRAAPTAGFNTPTTGAPVGLTPSPAAPGTTAPPPATSNDVGRGGAQTPTTGVLDDSTGGSAREVATVLRNLVDPSTLDELRRADGADDLDRQLRALRRAQGELEGMANELRRRARSLAVRADEIKRKK